MLVAVKGSKVASGEGILLHSLGKLRTDAEPRRMMSAATNFAGLTVRLDIDDFGSGGDDGVKLAGGSTSISISTELKGVCLASSSTSIISKSVRLSSSTTSSLLTPCFRRRLLRRLARSLSCASKDVTCSDRDRHAALGALTPQATLLCTSATNRSSGEFQHTRRLDFEPLLSRGRFRGGWVDA